MKTNLGEWYGAVMSEIVIHTDGAARGNPGSAAIAYVISQPGQVAIEHAEVIADTTNNQAEYQALLAALRRLQTLGPTGATIVCRADSELMVKQLNGEYKMKNADLRPHFEAINHLKTELVSAGNKLAFTHVRREQNRRADALCNLALDGQIK